MKAHSEKPQNTTELFQNGKEKEEKIRTELEKQYIQQEMKIKYEKCEIMTEKKGEKKTG